MKQVGIPHARGDLHRRAGHQRGALCTVCDPLHNFCRLLCCRRPHTINQLCVILHHIGRRAAAIKVGILQPRFLNHMLAQVVHPNIHQLTRIQRAAAKVRCPTRVGRDAFKCDMCRFDRDHLHVDDPVRRPRVPGKYTIGSIKIPVARHQGFHAFALFGGTAVIDHRARQAAGLQVLLGE
ncbi:hypothetical protein SDC9_147919 [bioreactor metagenome]|uniref:Uncharacterized protein n=1 Tax=bioreactor metagenome TaxID=1076179 RepID=A0A645EJI5_9ZZZZ